MGSIVSIAEAAEKARQAQIDGQTVVTTNGSFDLLHQGHEFLLGECKKQGDILIVGVNSDVSVKRYKGPDRPIDSEDTRAGNAAKHADYVFIFDDDDPRSWLKEIRPNVHCNAASYGEDCIEAPVVKDVGATLYLVPIQTELGSTTEILRQREQAS